MARDQESTNQSGSAHPPVPPAAQADRGVPPPSPLTRRGFLQALGGTALAGGAATLVGGCGKPQAPNLALDRRIKIGYVLPLTGAQGAFAEAENFNINKIREVLKNGLVIGKDHYGIDIIVKDSQTNEDRAATVARDLLDYDKVDLMLTLDDFVGTSIPTTNLCEQRGVPCMSTLGSWNTYVKQRGHSLDPPQPFQWTYHYYWGHPDTVEVFVDLWKPLQTNKVVVGLWPDDAPGNEAADPKTGYPPGLKRAGYKLVDPGRYENQNNSRAPDFRPLVDQIVKADPDLLTGAPLAVDFIDIWRQLADKHAIPPYVTMTRACNFPRQVEAYTPSADGISTSITWHPSFPFESSLTGQTAQHYADAYIEETGRQPTFTLGYGHSLWEVILDVLKRAGGAGDRDAVVEAMRTTKLDTLAGPVDFTNPTNPHPNIARMGLVAGQWKASDGEDYRFDLVVITNRLLPQVPVTGELTPIRQG
ncbi:MAG TPA: ABC transporter substrate-binding protein [Actinomycetes bacterium]|nr:ABC transporter substrate-binding protein [Actinomycetes bacterium]